LRKALNYAVNREELLKYGAMGNADALGAFIPPGVHGHNPELELYRYDTKKARSLVEEAGYPNGFRVKIIASEAGGLEAKIIGKMLERIGLQVSVDVLKSPKFFHKIYVPILDHPPEEQDWDISLWAFWNHFGHVGATLLAFGFLEESDFRWIEYDPVYENLWKNMVATVDVDMHEEKMRELTEYVYSRAYSLFVYSPLTLYAVNKEVNFVPQKMIFLRLKETSVTENHWSLTGKTN
jgi:ABC-type transport system substrate-binding protein